MDLHNELSKLSEQRVAPRSYALPLLRRALLSPLASVPLFFCASSLMVSALFGGLAFFQAVAAFWGVLSGVGFLYNLSARRKRFVERIILRQQSLAQAERLRVLASLQQHFLSSGKPDQHRLYREQAARQVRLVLEKYESFCLTLGSRFLPSELTYDRYMGTGREVFHHVVDNLNRALELLRAIDAIDHGYLENRLQALQSQVTLTPADEKERVALAKRQESWERMWLQVSELLTQNEESLTAFTDTVYALNELDLSPTQRARLSADLATKELKTLAERAKNLVSADD